MMDFPVDLVYTWCDGSDPSFQKEKNQGLSAARNSGLDIASGEYIIFVDSDDYVKSDYAEKLYLSIKENDSDMAVCMFDMIYAPESVSNKNIKLDPTENILWDELKFWNEKIINHNALARAYAWNKIYKKSAFAKLRYPIGKTWEDEYILHKVLSQCKNISIVPEILYFYTIRENSITGLNKTKAISFAEIENSFIQLIYLKEKGFKKVHQYAFMDIMLKFSDIYFRFDRNKKLYQKNESKIFKNEYKHYKKKWFSWYIDNKKELKCGLNAKFKFYIMLFKCSTPVFCFTQKILNSFRH